MNNQQTEAKQTQYSSMIVALLVEDVELDDDDNMSLQMLYKCRQATQRIKEGKISKRKLI